MAVQSHPHDMKNSVVAVILAGGQARRLGGRDKALISVNGRRLIDKCITALEPHCHRIALSVQPENSWAQDYGLPLLYDRPTPNIGPLGGIAAALYWADNQASKPAWVITTPVDLPFIPTDLVERLTRQEADVAVACSDGQAHHPVAAWKPSLTSSLENFLKNGTQSVHKFQSVCKVLSVKWETSAFDPFFNINTPEDLTAAEDILKTMTPDKNIIASKAAS